MKKNKIKFMLPVGIGLFLSIITVLGFISTTLQSCEKDDDSSSYTKHCKSGYPLWCSSVKTCCPSGYAYYCDGSCHSSPCPANTVTVDSCAPEQ
jgi:hypothetical protein